MSTYWQRFPCLVKYNPSTTVATATASPGTYPGVVLWMFNKRDGMVMFIPSLTGSSDPNRDLELGMILSPPVTEIALLNGQGVYVKNGQDPALQ